MSESNKPSCPYPKCVYDDCTGLMQGTIFPELDLNMCEYGKVCKQWGGGM